MKRREFVAGASVAMGGLMSPVEWVCATPCPPPLVSVTGGTLANTACGTDTFPQGSIISRVVPVTATSGNAAYISDANYNTLFRSSGGAVTINYDLATIPTANRQRLLFQWRGNNAYSVDHALLGQVGYNNLGSYTIEGNAAAGGGSAPTSGWVVLVTVAGNTRASRQHVLSNMSGYNWLRLVCTASDGSSGNTDIGIAVNIHDISNQSVIDGWLIVGDSITSNAMEWKNNGTVASESFGNRVQAMLGFAPPMDHGGWSGISASGLVLNNLSVYQAWIADFPGKYVGIVLGTNPDASESLYVTSLQTLITLAQSAGKTVVLGKPPYSPLSSRAHLAGYANRVEEILMAQTAVKRGPDMYAWFQAHPTEISSDGVHPNDTGNANFRRLWAENAIAIYQSGG